MELPGWKRKTPLQKEWDTLIRREQAFLDRRKTENGSALNQLLAKKVPEKLQRTLDAAFEKAFLLIFEKGIGVIEKTYRRNDLEDKHKINLYTDELLHSRKSLRAFSKNANQSSSQNLLLSGAAGVGMGLLGIGLPDIPLFTGIVLRCLYEISLHYGFDYHLEKEKYFILLLIEGAVSYGNHLIEIDQKIEAYSNSSQLPEKYSPAEQIAKTSKMLSKELLYMKFLQGIPIVGAVGGAYDIIYMRQIAEYAKLKYQKRFLQNHKK